jgi:poly(A)-specific ribonuclease
MAVTVVTKSNFIGLLPSILHHIKDADFITFDTELTGLTTGSQSKYFYYDDVIDRYRKLRDSASNFGMLQIGLSAFKYKASGDKYTSTSWSFHLFPVVGGSGNDFRRWTLQLSSITFLKEHGFDFNKTFLDGIPYLSIKEESDLRNKKTQTRVDKEVSINEEDAAWLAETVELVRRWIDMVEKEEEKIFILPPCNSFKRLLLHQTLPKEFGKEIVLKKVDNENGEACLSVIIVSPEERQAALEEELIEFEKSVTEQVGFRRVFDMITSMRKPMVGHNCWLDLCHIFNKFIGPMPSDWNSFKEQYESLNWGPLCDTKFIANLLIRKELLKGLGGTSLEQLATAVDDIDVWGVKTKVDGGKTKNRAKESFHDAGFDAYCTGKVFVGAATILAQKAGTGIKEAVEALFKRELEYVDRLFMMVSDMEGGVALSEAHDQWQPDRSHLRVLTDLTPDISVSHVHSLLIKAGAEKTKIQLFWHDNKTIFFACEGFEAPEGIIECQVGNATVSLKCMSYSQWKQEVIGSPPSAKRLREPSSV